MNGPPRLILASQSPARAKLLQAAGLTFAIRPAGLDEAAVKRQWQDTDAPPADLAGELARRKAETVAGDSPGTCVIGADQLLLLDGRVLDKPADLDAARQRLAALRGRTHRLVTAAAIVKDGAILMETIATADLHMRDFTDAFAEDYLADEGSGALSSVGAYRLEGPGIQLFERIDGGFDVILGLPLLPVLDALRTAGVLPS